MPEPLPLPIRANLAAPAIQYPDLKRSLPRALLTRQPAIWLNPARTPAHAVLPTLPIGARDIEAARARWQRFAPLLTRYFPELQPVGGRIDSPLLAIHQPLHQDIAGASQTRLFVKADHDLPVTGCIKARGGVYEVLLLAERVAIESGLFNTTDDIMRLAAPELRDLFNRHTVMVGSTGNLGFSVGIIACALGFQAEVHMSADAKAWKKERLRNSGVRVVEHAGDYTAAVATARAIARESDTAYFVDDEDSLPLFLGYAIAARDLAAQLKAAGVTVDAAHPLFVHLPCGVGGAPGGITFGLKHEFGDNVACLFVEPVDAPCVWLQLAAGMERSVSVREIGLTNHTAADGLAVAAASMFVVRTLERLIDACATVTDQSLFNWTKRVWDAQGFRVEPSAAAGFASATAVIHGAINDEHAGTQLSRAADPQATHVIWTTGGSLLPEAEFRQAVSRSS